MSLLKLLASNNFITVNKSVIRELGLTEAVVLGVLCGGYDYCATHGLLNGDYFPFSRERLQEETSLGETAQRNAINILVGRGILEKKNLGNPQTRHFRINEEVLLQILRNQGTKLNETSSLNPTERKDYIDNNNINNSNNKTYEEEYSLSPDEMVAETIAAWNSNQHIKAKIDRIPFGTKRYDNMMMCIAEYGWERFISEIRNLDSNKFIETVWHPSFDSICDRNKFMKLADGEYRELKETAEVDKYSEEYWKTL